MGVDNLLKWAIHRTAPSATVDPGPPLTPRIDTGGNAVAATQTRDPAEREQLGRTTNTEIGSAERVISAAAGAALGIAGLTRRGVPGISAGIAGGWLVYRGVTGHDPIYRALGINTARSNAGPRAVVHHKRGVKVVGSVTIDRPAAELYRFWRNVENLPHVMSHLRSVTARDGTTSHWVTKAPAGRTVEWDAEIITERENELIGWRSLPGSGIANAGSVHFRPAPGGHGTELTVEINYEPPLGPTGAVVASLLGEEPSAQLRDDLRRFKARMEGGEDPTGAMSD
jgi:uncharacterized membrane protein